MRLNERTLAHLLLTLCILFWSGNFIAGRAMVGEVPPIALAFWRWMLASLILLPWALGPLRRDWPLLRAHLGKMSLLALLGVSGFNTLVYVGLQHTTAINGLLMQSTLPLLIILWGWLLFREPPRLLQILSLLVSLVGVVLIVSRGQPHSLLQGAWNPGDLWILSAVLLWSWYSLGLRWRPPGLQPLAFLGFTLIAGTILLLPWYAWELAQGQQLHLTGDSVLAILYVAIFPSVLSFLFWNRGVTVIGAQAAGHFIHLNPLFGAVLAMLLLGEQLHWYHAAGAVLIGTAIVLNLRQRG